VWYKNIAGRFFGLVTKHAYDRRTDGRTDGQNYDSQDRASIAASRVKNCHRQSCSAINCLSSGINTLAGGRPLPHEILARTDLPPPASSESSHVLPCSASTVRGSEKSSTRMWANAQRDGRPAEHRWRPLFNAAKFS